MHTEPERGEHMYWVEFDEVGKGIEGKFLYMAGYSFEIVDEPRNEDSFSQHAA